MTREMKTKTLETVFGLPSRFRECVETQVHEPKGLK